MAGTLVCFHAHPDDEAITTGGTMARAAAEGHRVVVVFATRGELGEVDDGVLKAGETLADRRVEEAQRAADVLGVKRVTFLGYRDSGMAGEETNHTEGSFASAAVDEAADRLAEILRDEQAEVLTAYDERGAYGHPDHIKVHDVGLRAGALAGTRRIYAATYNRQHFVRIAKDWRHTLPPEAGFPDPAEFDLGVDEQRITTTVDVKPRLEQKRAAMAAHASQVSEESYFLAMSDDAFSDSFGTEWFIRVGAEPTLRETWLF